MLRLLISFVLALLGHLYLLQFQVNLDDTSPAELISDNSVSVTLNQYTRNKSVKKVEPSPQSETEVQQQPEIVQQTQKRPQPVAPAPSPAPKKKPPETIKKNQKKVKREVVPPAKTVQPDKAPPVQEKENRQEIAERSKKVTQSQPSPSTHDMPVATPLESGSEAEVASVIKARPHYQYNPKPKYPKIARRRGWEGTVMLQVVVDEKGEAASVQLYKSCGYKILDKSALEAVKIWRFIAGSIGGKAARSVVIIPVHFKLRK